VAAPLGSDSNANHNQGLAPLRFCAVLQHAYIAQFQDELYIRLNLERKLCIDFVQWFVCLK
jgi:hypothetical protein